MHQIVVASLTIKMEQLASKIVNNYFNTNIYSYLETSGGQSLNQYLNVVHFEHHCCLYICGSFGKLFFCIGVYYALFY